MTNKQLVIEAVQDLPDEASFDEILERIEILAELRRAEADIDAGRFTTQEDLKRQVKTWLSE